VKLERKKYFSDPNAGTFTQFTVTVPVTFISKMKTDKWCQSLDWCVGKGFHQFTGGAYTFVSVHHSDGFLLVSKSYGLK